MGAQQRLVPQVGLIEYANGSFQSTAHNRQTVITDINLADGALMSRLHEELTEIERPHSHVLVLASSHTESLIDCNSVNGGLVGSVCGFQSLGRVVNLEHHAVL